MSLQRKSKLLFRSKSVDSAGTARRVAAAILTELEVQMREMEDKCKARANEQRKLATGVDYSWLVTSAHKYHQLTEVERLTLEDLSSSVTPDECNHVITVFRNALASRPDAPVQSLPMLMMTSVKQVLESRPPEESTSTKLLKGVAKFRPLSARVVPISKAESQTDRKDLRKNNSIDDLPV